MQRNNTRRESRNIAGRFRAGKLAPVLAVPFLPGEGGVLRQSFTAELDPVAGRLVTPVTVQLTSVYVPVQAMDALRAETLGEPYPGMAEVIRQKMLSGNPLFTIEDEHEVSKRLGIIPRSIGGVKKVSVMARLAHNAAVNMLRKRLYTYAVELAANDYGVTPALLSSTILQRMNGALDPDEHVNGAVNLNLPDINLPVSGIGVITGAPAGTVGDNVQGYWSHGGAAISTVPKGRTGQDVTMRTDALGLPDVFAKLNGTQAGQVSLSDFYNAEKIDNLTRNMREIADRNPLDGEDMVLRWAHGLSVDPGRHPFVIFEQERVFGQVYQEAQDGNGLMDEVALSKLMQRIEFTVPVPTTELGGIVITFASVKPDETIAAQPHPILSDNWGAINQVSEELKFDPVPVTMRELSADATTATESTVAFYTGHNELKKFYLNYGFNRHVDPETVASKTAVWQLDLPASVTPENIVYPETISQYPFLDQDAEIATYTIQSEAVIRTPMYFGPSPVETLDVIADQDLFDQE